MTNIVKPDNAKPIWGRSGALMAGVLLAFREIVPTAPWWASLILAGVVLIGEQVFRPSTPASK